MIWHTCTHCHRRYWTFEDLRAHFAVYHGVPSIPVVNPFTLEFR